MKTISKTQTRHTAFANAAAAKKTDAPSTDAGTSGAPNTDAAANGNAGVTAGKARPDAPVIMAVRTDIALPTRGSGLRGTKSPYDFAMLPVGGSIGITNKTAKQLSSIVSNFNRRDDNREIVRDDAGNIVFETQDITAQDGTVTKIPTSKAVTRPKVEIVAIPTNPATDPDGAKVRVFRKR